MDSTSQVEVLRVSADASGTGNGGGAQRSLEHLPASGSPANVTGSDEGTFAASFEDAKTVVHMLQALATGKRDQFACVVVSDSALRFSVETASKNLLGVAYITADILSELRVPLEMDSKQIEFKVNLHLLLECLQIFGVAALATTHCQLTYSSADCILRMLLEEGGVVTEVELATADPSDEVDLLAVFREQQAVCSMSVSSSVLQEALGEVLILPGLASVALEVQDRAPNVRIVGASDTNTVAVDMNDANEVFLSFDCKAPISVSVPAAALIAATRALGSATEAYIRVNTAGVFNIMHRVLAGNGSEVFISFTLLPEVQLQVDISSERDASSTSSLPAASAAAPSAAAAAPASSPPRSRHSASGSALRKADTPSSPVAPPPASASAGLFSVSPAVGGLGTRSPPKRPRTGPPLVVVHFGDSDDEDCSGGGEGGEGSRSAAANDTVDDLF